MVHAKNTKILPNVAWCETGAEFDLLRLQTSLCLFTLRSEHCKQLSLVALRHFNTLASQLLLSSSIIDIVLQNSL